MSNRKFLGPRKEQQRSGYTPIHSTTEEEADPEAGSFGESRGPSTASAWYQASGPLPPGASSTSAKKASARKKMDDLGNITDDNDNSDGEGVLRDKFSSADEFGGRQNYYQPKGTGRQRKKVASRGKGGEFQAKRKKRRVYACCIGTEIDTEKFDEHLGSLSTNKSPMKSRWSTMMYTDTLRVYRNSSILPTELARSIAAADDTDGEGSAPIFFNYATGQRTEILIGDDERSLAIRDLSFKFNDPYVKEIFIFEFGAVVFWGFSSGEEKEFLNLIRQFVSKGPIPEAESIANEDDMAFITTPIIEAPALAIANDVLTLPEDTNAKQRLALSFAIGQSTVLAVFESRVEAKVADYKYIPETLAQSGKIKLPSGKIGTMIGEIFVIRHDLNLHTDILDTPDFFWEEEKYAPDYKIMWRYLEMSGRVEVLNKRLDMLKELLDVLQQQMENAHASKLEWIVIWLILIEVIIEVVAIASGKMFH
jgi:uncharacterized Rmd1/YagE family protein